MLFKIKQNGRPSRRNLLSIQYLRGFAAIIVVYYHIFANPLTEKYSALSKTGAFGVDIFFVISGFIIWTSSGSGQEPIATFIRRRALRIYPAYWLALITWVLVRLVVPDRLHNLDVTGVTVLSSFMLIPHFHAVFVDRVWPILVPGWTLQYELFFYAVFAVCLMARRSQSRFAALVLSITGLVAIGGAVRPESAIGVTYTNPVLLEFLAGAVLGLARPALKRLGAAGGMALVVVGLLSLGVTYPYIDEFSAMRVLTLGVPAALVVMGGVALETALSQRPIRVLELLGDASYSLYLTHPLSISIVVVAWKWLHFPAEGTPYILGLILLELATAITGGFAFYFGFESPLRRLVRTAKPANRPLIA